MERSSATFVAGRVPDGSSDEVTHTLCAQESPRRGMTSFDGAESLAYDLVLRPLGRNTSELESGALMRLEHERESEVNHSSRRVAAGRGRYGKELLVSIPVRGTVAQQNLREGLWSVISGGAPLVHRAKTPQGGASDGEPV